MQCSAASYNFTSCLGRLRHGSTISRIAAVSAREYHLHLICIIIINARARDLFQSIYFIILCHEPASSYLALASDRFAEQKMRKFVLDSVKRLIRTFADTSASQILLI